MLAAKTIKKGGDMGLKLRLDKALTTIKGKPIMVDKDQDEVNEELKRVKKANKDRKPDDQKEKAEPTLDRPLTVGDVIDRSLLGALPKKDKEGNFIKDKMGNLIYEPIDRKERELRYQLALRIYRHEDIKAEDASKLKELISDFYPTSTLVTGVMNTVILEGKQVEHGQFKPEGEKNDGPKA